MRTLPQAISSNAAGVVTTVIGSRSGNWHGPWQSGRPDFVGCSVLRGFSKRFAFEAETQGCLHTSDSYETGSRFPISSLSFTGHGREEAAFLREAPERAIGTDRPACRLVRRSFSEGVSLPDLRSVGEEGGGDWRAGKGEGSWLKCVGSSGMKHVCRQGCMFPNVVFESAGAWNEVLKSMVEVDEAL